MVDVVILTIIFIVVFLSSTVGSLTGGGGLIVMPMLLAFGIDPLVALGSRRISVLGGSITGIAQFKKHNKIDFKLSLSFLPFALVGSLVGFGLVGSIDKLILKKLIGAIIIVILFVMIYNNFRKVKPATGFLYKYRNFFGPLLVFTSVAVNTISSGGATLVSFILIVVYHKSILESSGTRKFPLLLSLIIVSALFVINGYVDYILAAVMFVAHGAGVWFGSAYFLKRGDDRVKYIFYTIIFILAIKILFF